MVCSDWEILLVLQQMEIAIKNMVCDRCVKVVGDIMARLAHPQAQVTMGRVTLDAPLSDDELTLLDKMLVEEGFELLRDRDSSLVERIKGEVIQFARDAAINTRVKLSAYLADRLATDYRTLGRVFSEHEGRTIERYHIAQKIEYVKELLAYGEMTVSEVADITGYSSAAHLSRQFHAETGMTPTEYRERTPRRTPLDKV